MTQRRLVAYLDGLAGRVARLQRLQPETVEELDALMPSIPCHTTFCAVRPNNG